MSPTPSAVRTWMIAVRLRTLPAALAPVVVGAALAFDAGEFKMPATLTVSAVALLLQIGANLANDAFDHARGADTPDRLGPTRVTQTGLLSFRQVMTGVVLVSALAAGIGSYLVWLGGWPILLLGIAALIAMLAYTGGPAPLGYLGLGEAAVFLFFGMIGVGGTYYIQAHELPLRVVILSVPVGTLTSAILVVNNLRDIETDARAEKRTLAVRLGAAASSVEYAALLLAAYLILPALWLTGNLTLWWIVPWVSLPFAATLIRAIRRERGRLLNRRLAQTAQLALAYSLLLGLAVIL